MFLFFINPSFLKAQTNYSNQEFKQYEEEIKFITENFSFEDMVSDIHESKLYKELIEQFNLTEELKDFFTLETHPQKNIIPKPKEKVALVIKTTLDSKTTHYTWIVDQKIIKEGYGLTTFDFTTKEIGESSNVSVIIKTDSGLERTKSITLTPATVDVFWQTDTYTPALYKGKNLNSSYNKGKIDFIALPNFTGTDKIENPNNYIYTWLLNGSQYRSGRGMNSISLDLSELLIKSTVQVGIKPLNSEVVLRENINFPNFVKPEVLIYKTDSSYGTDYNKAINYLKEYQLNQDLLTVKAEPLFFTNFKESDLEINWSMNNSIIPSFKDSYKAYFSVDRDFTGKSSVSVSIKNKDNIREKFDSNVLFSVNRVNSGL